MEKKNYDVNSKGKVLGTVAVNVYATIAEAEKDLGAEAVVGLINRQHKADVTNEFRANATRTVSTAAQLKKIGEKDPKAKAEIDALLKKYGMAPAAPKAE